MNKDAIVIDGQKAQENVVPVETAAANDAMQKTGISETAGFASTKIKNMISAPDFRSGDGFISADELEKRKNIAWAPEFVGQSAAYTEDFTSDTGTIIADSVKQFGMSLMTMGDKAQIGLGGILSKLTGGAIGEEMRDRAYESLEAAISNIRVQNTHAADAETLTAAITQGAASMLEMMAVSLMTGGVAPLAQMGVEVFGDGMYNNMVAYAKENGGSIEGYEGNWGEIGIDLLNAAVQVGIERKLGLGSGRFLKRTGGHFLKEAVEGAAQEGTQAYLTDLGEWLKDNAEAPTNWENYIVSAAIGGVLQGALGAATYKNARLKADGEMAEMFFQAKKRKTPDRDEDEMRKEARSDAKQFNDDVEDGIVKDGWEEFANRVDTNNDRGIVRDNLVKEFTKARVAALGLESENDLDADDIADIQDAATIAAGEAFRESVINGISIMDTMTARLVADGKGLVVRDLQLGEQGVAEKSPVDISLDEQKLVQQMADKREAAQAAREQKAEQEIRTEQIAERMTEIGRRKRPDGYTAKQIETNIRNATDEQLRDWVQGVAGYKNTRYFGRAALVDYALRNKSQWKYIEPKQRETGEQVMKRLGQRQDAMDRFFEKEDAMLSQYTGVPESVIKKMSDAEYNTFKAEAMRRYSEEQALRTAQMEDGLIAEDIPDIPFQDSLDAIARGAKKGTKRGAYDPRYQRIILNKDSDISTILHELSHMWLNNWFKAYRSENAPESFKKWWKPVEKALGIRESDRFLNKDASEKFARGFEKWVMDGGKGGADSLQPVYDRLSKRLADIYDDLATRYFDMVADLKPEVNAWFAQNEYVADGMVVDVVDEEGVPTGETTRMEPTRNRAAERKDAMRQAELNEKIDSGLDGAADIMGDAIYGKAISGEELESKISRDLTQEASAKGVHDDLRVMYDRSASKGLADRSIEFALLDFDSAYQVAMGNKSVPEGLTLPSVFTAVRHVAKTREDGGLYLTALKNSPALQMATKAGQALTQFKDYFGGSGVADVPRILKELDSMYAKNMTKADVDYVKKNADTINKLIAKHDLDYDAVWESILNYIQCK